MRKNGVIELINRPLRDGRKASGVEAFDAGEAETIAYRCTGKRFLPIFLASFIFPKLALKLVRD